jgi:hypothetical protein
MIHCLKKRRIVCVRALISERVKSEEHMKKLLLLAVSAAAIAIAAPQFASAAPAGNGAGLVAASEAVSPIESSYYRRYYGHRYYHPYRRYYRHRYY